MCPLHWFTGCFCVRNSERSKYLSSAVKTDKRSDMVKRRYQQHFSPSMWMCTTFGFNFQNEPPYISKKKRKKHHNKHCRKHRHSERRLLRRYSGVATLSCTDSSTASSDASDPGSPYSPGSIGEDTHQLLKSNMTPQILQAAQIQQHQSNSIKSQWPWNTSKTVNNNNNVKAINNNTNLSTGNKLKRLSSHSVNDAVATAKKLRTAGNSGDKLSASLIGGSNVGSNAKRLKTAPEETQQTKITGYFKSQMKPLNGLKKEISNLVARSSIEAQSAAGGLDKYFNILAKAKDDKDQSTAHGIKKDFELDVRTLTTMSTPSLKKIERKTTTKVAQVAPMTRKTNTTLPTSNLNGKSPKKHVAIAPRTSEVKKTQANSIRKGTNGNMQQIDTLKSSQPTVLLTAIRIPASIHQTSGVSTLSSNGPTKIAPKPQPSQTLSNAVTSSTSLNTSPNKVNPLFQIPVMPNLVQIPNLITTSRANLVMNNGQLTRMGNSTQYFVNGTVIKVQQIGGTPNGVTNGNTTNSMLSMESGLTSNILLKQATIAQTVPFSTITTTTKAALPIQQQSLSISSQSLSSQTIPTIQSSLSSGSQTSVTTTSLGNQSFVSNGSSSRIQPQSVFMATSAGLLLNATLPAVITTSKLPGLNQPLPALHPIQPSTQSTNILPSINTILQSSHHPHSAQLTTSVAPQIIVSQSHQSLVNISQPTLSSIANTNGVTRSQQSLPPLTATTSSPPEIIAPKLSEPPSLRLISNTVSDILTSTTTTTTFTSTLTSWSKQIAETIQNDSEKTIRRESFKPSISLREPVLPPLLPITLPTLPPPLPPVSIAPVVSAATIKCENKTAKDLDSIKLATKPTEPPLIWVKTTSDLPASPKLPPPEDKENKEVITEPSLPAEPKSLILEDKEEKPSPDVFIEEKEEEKLNLAEEVKPTILKEVIANEEDKLNNTEARNDVEHNDSTEIETETVKANGIDLSAVEVDIDLVNKTTSAVNGCAKSPILSQPKTIRFPALKSDSNFRFGPKGTKRHDGVCYWDNCNQKYDTCSKLLDHLQTQHVNTQTGPYSCLWSGCKVHGRESCSRRWLERHALSHGGTKPFKCIVDGCGLRFGSQLALQKHVNGHFNTTENKDNPNKRTSDPPVPKLLRKNGKKLRYRRQPFSEMLQKFFVSKTIYLEILMCCSPVKMSS